MRSAKSEQSAVERMRPGGLPPALAAGGEKTGSGCGLGQAPGAPAARWMRLLSHAPRSDQWTSGGIGQRDDAVLARCIKDDLNIVTVNATDFRKLVAQEAIHPGLVILPCVDREKSLKLLIQAVEHMRPDAMDMMVNKVLEITESGHIRVFDLPAPGS